MVGHDLRHPFARLAVVVGQAVLAVRVARAGPEEFAFLLLALVPAPISFLLVSKYKIS